MVDGIVMDCGLFCSSCLIVPGLPSPTRAPRLLVAGSEHLGSFGDE